MQQYMAADFQDQVEHLEQELSNKSKCAIRIHRDAKQNLSKLFSKMRTKWQESGRNMTIFFNKNREWLEMDVAFPGDFKPDGASIRGRPSLDFAASTERSKRRKKELHQSHTAEELCSAAQMSLRSSGDLDLSEIIKNLITPAPAPALSRAEHTMLSAEEALSVMVEAKLTRYQYNTIRTSTKHHNCQLYPNYEAVREAKALCYPPRSSISITEHCADIKLQDLLDHTCTRILLSQGKVLQSVHMDNLVNGNLICKWGCDGSFGQSVYKQKFHDDSYSAANIFLTSLVPLQLTFFESKSTDSDSKILWKNTRPSSPRFSQPMKMQFLHENTQSTKEEIEYVEKQTSSLKPLKIGIDGREVTVNYKMLFTMIDEKVRNAVTSTSSTQRCYSCGATSNDSNHLDKILEREANESLKFAMSPLHAWIRLFECLLHLSYKLDLKKWQTRTEDEKKLVSDRKAQIRKSLKSELGLIVDRSKPGYGSTNDRNTARRFFENHEITSMIIGLKEERLRVILQVIASGYDINVDNLKKYALETAKLFVSEYSWYYMPTSVHKIWIHGFLMIGSAILPVGQLSGEAQEARYKDIKKFRDRSSRKSSRENTMQDMLNWLLVSFDPFITNLRNLPRTKL